MPKHNPRTVECHEKCLEPCTIMRYAVKSFTRKSGTAREIIFAWDLTEPMISYLQVAAFPITEAIYIIGGWLGVLLGMSLVGILLQLIEYTRAAFRIIYSAKQNSN